MFCTSPSLWTFSNCEQNFTFCGGLVLPLHLCKCKCKLDFSVQRIPDSGNNGQKDGNFWRQTHKPSVKKGTAFILFRFVSNSFPIGATFGYPKNKEMNQDEKKVRTPSTVRNFCFTLNNYSAADVGQVRAFAGEYCNYLVYGEEVSESGTPHLQGYAALKKVMGFNSCRVKLGGKAHIESKRGTTKDAVNYCKKGDQPHAEWSASKEAGPTFGKNAKVWEHGELRSEQGRRTDLDKVAEAIQDGATLGQLAEEFPREMIKFHRGVMAVRDLVNAQRSQRILADVMRLTRLKPWQQWVVDKLDELLVTCDDRKVIWIWDTAARSGKSFLAKYLQSLGKAQRIGAGKYVDMAYLLDVDMDIVLCDVPYAWDNDKLCYAFFEDCRNGSVQSTKYTPVHKVKYPAGWRVVVFSNNPPADAKMAEDRYILRKVQHGKFIDLDEIAEEGDLTEEEFGDLPPPPRLVRQNAMSLADEWAAGDDEVPVYRRAQPAASASGFTPYSPCSSLPTVALSRSTESPSTE